MIPQRRTRARMNVRVSERVDCPGHLKWTRGNLCLASSAGNCSLKMEAHHVREGQTGGTGLKPGDDSAVGLCSHHHAEGHAIGWKTFEQRYRVDLDKAAADLWRVSPHGVTYRMKKDRAND